MFWLEQLEYALLQRFPTLTLQEIQQMLQMTPLEETVAGKELMAIGLKKGEIIGEIRTCQRVLRLPVSSRQTLLEMAIDQLRALHEKLNEKL